MSGSRIDQLHEKVNALIKLQDRLIVEQEKLEKTLDSICNMLDNIDIKVQGSMVILSDLNDDMINRS